jgi:predicted metal-dependent phosphoesterase TrpH
MVSSHERVSSVRTYSRDVETLQRVFHQVNAASCPRSFNFHMHTVCSDGRLTPEALMEQVIELGLTAFAITDHHSVEGYYRAKGWLEDWHWRNPSQFSRNQGLGLLPRLFSGVEITSRLADSEVHILGYGFNPTHTAMEPYLKRTAPQSPQREAGRVIQGIHQAGGLAVLAHPARYRQPPETLVAVAKELGIDGIETYYAYDNPSHWRSCPNKTPTIQALAARYQLFSTCGTDTHGLNITRRL